MPPRTPDATRQKLLAAAFAEFYRQGFQAGSLSRITAAAGATKGALFHHFAGKLPLGYAVVDEIVEPLVARRWLEPFRDAADPVAVLQDAFRRGVREDVAAGSWLHGCPLNNLAQEMSPLDDGFRHRVDRLYALWRGTVAAALAAGQRRGTVRRDVDPRSAAAFVVASQMGVWGTGKYSQDETLMTRAAEAACEYLATLKG